ncbi:HD domain-containing protein [Granulicella tundricola]|uniref:Metal dependent phosphohydrolase n=1 Tax=Granulicella tundricola (strain ATCC BAA-1859 / DSM 23138 / MP5ACTX9) TaxID=1198114 RepID=E8WW84_GRATM|nr:HD domain-containing protein [Granulicella tundricola]ADW68467.1 metal dependent phosphohydrolase [Granulicella tundricola MP5ACTX9]
MAAPSWRSALEEYIRREAQPPEKFGHQPRLYELTRQIGQGIAYDDEVVCAAVWLHDLGVFTGHRPEDLEELKRWDNTAYAIAKAPALLNSFGFPQHKIPAVLECIRTHQPSFSPESIEATILRDADILEQLGAVGILRTVCKVGRDTRFATFTQAAASLQKALDTLPALLLLPASRALAEDRIHIHRAFLQAVTVEAQDSLY